MEAICANCSYKHQAESLPLINVQENPSLKEKVMDGSLFVWECPCCGRRNLLKFQTVYHDPSRRLMVWLLPEGEKAPEAVEAAITQLEDYTLRRVTDPGALMEKVKIAEAGLDDAAMEMCKYVTAMEMYKKNPDNAIMEATFRFVRLEGADNDILLAFPLGNQMQVVNIGFNVYEDARAILSRNPEAAPGRGFASVDRNYILTFFR